MGTTEPVIITSPLSQTLEREDHSLRVLIYRAPDEDWILEVVESDGTSHIYSDVFETDQQAMDVLLTDLDERGVEAFLQSE